jgi:hypothetical protein
MRPTTWKDTLIRAGRTFVQAFIAYLAVNLAISPANLVNAEAFKTWAATLGVSAVAAGLAAVMNLPKKE